MSLSSLFPAEAKGSPQADQTAAVTSQAAPTQAGELEDQLGGIIAAAAAEHDSEKTDDMRSIGDLFTC